MLVGTVNRHRFTFLRTARPTSFSCPSHWLAAPYRGHPTRYYPISISVGGGSAASGAASGGGGGGAATGAASGGDGAAATGAATGVRKRWHCTGARFVRKSANAGACWPLDDLSFGGLSSGGLCTALQCTWHGMWLLACDTGRRLQQGAAAAAAAASFCSAAAAAGVVSFFVALDFLCLFFPLNCWS